MLMMLVIKAQPGGAHQRCCRGFLGGWAMKIGDVIIIDILSTRIDGHLGEAFKKQQPHSLIAGDPLLFKFKGVQICDGTNHVIWDLQAHPYHKLPE
jgi:hypothetical protein